MKKEESYTNIRKILEGTELINVNNSPKGRGLRFPIYLSAKMAAALAWQR